MSENNNIPYQVEQLIDNLFNPRDNIHVRGNYRTRLLVIKQACEKAIAKYDNELFKHNTVEQPRRKKRA